MSRLSWCKVGGVAALAFLMAGWLSPSADLSPVETTRTLQRLTLSTHPETLQGIHLLARESWVQTGQTDSRDFETDDVIFYDGVPLEIQQTQDNRPLKPSEQSHQQKMAAQVEQRIDRAGGAVMAGRLMNLSGEIWPVARFEQLFIWSARTGPNGEILLHFVPVPGIHPTSRMQRILSVSEGDLRVDATTGQLLGGTFHSRAPVKFGGGLLAHIAHFDGAFTMQPAGQAWVLRQIVVNVQGRELFSRMHGTETMDYTVASAR